MTPLEFAAHRHLVGHSRSTLAKYLTDCGHEATKSMLQEWECGAAPVPDAVAEVMRDLARVHREFVADHLGLPLTLPRATGTVALAASILDRDPNASINWEQESPVTSSLRR